MGTRCSPCRYVVRGTPRGRPRARRVAGRVDWASGPEATLWHTGFTGTFSLVPGSRGIGVILPSSTTHNPDLAELDILDVPDLVADCRRRGIVLSFGHSDADASQARRGVDASGQAVTHIFNAMSPISARAPGRDNCRLGACADLVVLGDDLEVKDVLLEGRSLS